ncbi:sterol desaturase family protein [Sphingomonas nostoxanthinifaciens]|uniref:sterol desaturase family protein n=1 Tax=Sphingomonas nostoxanthinifaciens TaxID=2872652 RepID=UPI001CC1E6CB|nr:sterol desaturase family protein [Sphingomonas nostoxanthinifaciens]UAK26770.1 sterol desaturase family protein [Sphingomonas nostoxanthinifaciens]
MNFHQLVVAFFQYPAVIAYLLLAAVSAGVWAWRPAGAVATVASIAVAVLLYPLVWYSLHRWVLHSRWMFKVPLLAATWKRIHYDHHQDPNRLEILFGALHTTLPMIVAMTVPIGWLIGGVGGAAAAFTAGLLTTAFYEFCHCIQHLAYTPKHPMLVMMKQRHMAHHFHDETGNFGITNFFWDRLFGTSYEKVSQRKKSATVFNLGYTPEVALRYPKVAKLSGGVATGHPATRIRQQQG